MNLQHISETHDIRVSLSEVVRTLMLNSDKDYKQLHLVFQEVEEHKLVEKTVKLDLQLYLRWGDMPVLRYKTFSVADTYVAYIYMVNWF